MNPKIKRILLIGLPLAGVIAGYLLMARTVTATVDGRPVEIHTRAFTVKGALRSAGISYTAEDALQPTADTWLSRDEAIDLYHARQVRIWLEPQGKTLEVRTAERTPGDLLGAVGITPGIGDLVLLNGKPIDMQLPVPRAGDLVLQFKPASTLQLTLDGEAMELHSTAADVSTALWQEGIELRGGDAISVPYRSPLIGVLEAGIRLGQSLAITVDGVTVSSYSAAATVGEALAESGIALEDLDYSQPAETDPLPPDGVIKVIRVNEEIVMEQSAIPYETQQIPDDTMEMDARVVEQEGANGIKASRVRVRYEDGVEVSRKSEQDIILVAPVTQIVRYGSKITDKYFASPDGNLTYYLAVTVTATSYSPCRLGVPNYCNDITASGAKLRKGLVAMNLSWYRIFKGTQVYIPGYGVGTVADTGAYPGTNYWIDLGYSDNDFVSWGARSVTIYFLSPAPAGFTGVLP